jgi:hypothetical protein
MTYWIIPTNEGQELGYIETFKGSIKAAELRARDVVRGLKPVLKQGTVGCVVQDTAGNEIIRLGSEA